MSTASERIASFAASLENFALDEARQHLAQRAFLDTFACAIAGRKDAAPRIAREYVANVVGLGGATGWTTGERLPAESAAWLNGIAGHVLDYDDVLTPMRGHISVALVPALVALSQEHGIDGRRFALAYMAGFEVMAKLSRVMALDHYSKGWHSTSSMGMIGATVACGVLLRLDRQQIANALGLAVAQASGTRENFGTMAKSFQAGHCGAAAVRAVKLAQAGFDSSAGALDGKYGFLALYAGNEDLSAMLDRLASPVAEIDAMGIDIKKYPCCYANHRALDGMLALRSEHALTLDKVERVEMLTSARGLEALIHPRPQTGLEAKFSFEYAMAAALLDGQIRLSSYEDAMVRRPEIQAFLPRVTKTESPGPVLPRWSEIKVGLKNGDTFTRLVRIARGDAADPLSDEELIEKVADCFQAGERTWSAADFAARVFDLANSNFNEVLRPLYP
jgi:2-methylcitrate dehydratase PrpD